jgi:N utilization substance protein B
MKGSRRVGRELALKLLYSLTPGENELGDEVLEEFWRNFRFRDDVLGEPYEEIIEPVPYDIRRFTEELVLGAVSHLETIDPLIAELSTNWSIDRMARVDLAILRLGAFELLYRQDIPASVIINEAIEIGKRFGTRETPSFINGILDKISRLHRPPA